MLFSAKEISVDAPIIEQRKHPPKHHSNSKIKSIETNLELENREPSSSTTCDSPLTRTSESEAIKNSEAENVNINHDSTITETSEEEADQASEKSVAIKNSVATHNNVNHDSTIAETSGVGEADNVSVASTENHVDASNSSCNVIPVKKPGRPKKIVSDEAAALPTTLPKRKRGRPKKEVIESDSESEASTSQIRKMRRVNNIFSDESDLSDSGPLVKPTVKRILSSGSGSDSETKSNRPATNNTSLITPKKRGRPRKISENLDAETKSNATSDTPLITPRKRGRPKKGEESVKKEVKPFSAPILPILMGTSRNGRKRKELDYSFIEQPDLLDKSKSLNKVYDDKESNIVEDTENDVKPVENSKYRWTGHTTTALNQLFSALQGKTSSEVR